MSSGGKVNLRGVFDRITNPQVRKENPGLFFAYYRVDVDQPCTLVLKVFDPLNNEIRGSWNDDIKEAGLVQSVWALTTTLFKLPGAYRLELRQRARDSEELSLATVRLVVDK